jgi:uncharacterized protein involved in propanediol utilization
MPSRQGYAEAIGHHGELLQGVFEDKDANLRRALVSLPCRQLRSKATFEADASSDTTVTPAHCVKAKRAAELVISRFARSRIGGHLAVASNIPVSRGMGSSTADVLASILAVLDCLEVDASPECVMEMAVTAETACDSTLFKQQAVLFAHRDGVVIESFTKSLPPVDFISINATPDAGVDTLDFEPARYNKAEIETFRPLRSLIRQAIQRADARLLGRVATASAHINERFLHKPRLAEIEVIGARHGAIGIQVAHSGTVVGLMFDANDETTGESMELASRDLQRSDFDLAVFRH